MKFELADVLGVTTGFVWKNFEGIQECLSYVISGDKNALGTLSMLEFSRQASDELIRQHPFLKDIRFPADHRLSYEEQIRVMNGMLEDLENKHGKYLDVQFQQILQVKIKNKDYYGRLAEG